MKAKQLKSAQIKARRVCLKICKLVYHALKYKDDMNGFKMSKIRTNHSCDTKENQTEDNALH